MEKYQSISIMKAKKGEGIIWVVILTGNVDDPKDFTQREFPDFNQVKEFIATLSL